MVRRPMVRQYGDGAAAYQLAVVVDDGASGVDQVVRGDDLLSSAPTQAWLATRLGLPVPTYAHVPLALNVDGGGWPSATARSPWPIWVRSAGLPPGCWACWPPHSGWPSAASRSSRADLLARFDPTRLPREPWIVRPDQLAPS